jgi:hypothetical protein
MSKTKLAILIYASVATFRRAGRGFTDQGTAFPEGVLTKDELAAINAEPRLSVKEVAVDDIPQGVDRTLLDTSDADEEAEAEAEKAAKATATADAKAPKK